MCFVIVNTCQEILQIKELLREKLYQMGKLILQNCFCMGWDRYDQQLSLLFEEVVDFVMSADMKGHPHYIFQALCMISKLTLAWITTRRRANAKWGQRVQIRPFVISCWEGSVAGGCGARLQISAFLPFVVMTLSPCGIKTCCLSKGKWHLSGLEYKLCLVRYNLLQTDKSHFTNGSRFIFWSLLKLQSEAVK